MPHSMQSAIDLTPSPKPLNITRYKPALHFALETAHHEIAKSEIPKTFIRRRGRHGIRTGKREPIGGASPRKSRYEIGWKNPVTSETVRIRITHARDYLSQGTDRAGPRESDRRLSLARPHKDEHEHG